MTSATKQDAAFSSSTPEAPGKTRIVEVRVWSAHVGALTMTPLSTAESREAVRDAAGAYDLGLEERVQEAEPLHTEVFFADGDDCVLSVVDGGKCIAKQDGLPTVSGGYLVGYAKALHEHGEVTEDNFEQYHCCEEDDERPLYGLLARADAPDEADFNASTLHDAWKALQNGTLSNENMFMKELIHRIGKELAAGTEPQAFLDTIGDMGKLQIVFYVEIPENEPFDIGKLHFFADYDWVDDSRVHDAIVFFPLNLDTSLELLEYNGKIFCRELEPEGIWGWKIYNTVLVHADLSECDPEELLGEGDE